jgi:hypothetical protein
MDSPFSFMFASCSMFSCSSPEGEESTSMFSSIISGEASMATIGDYDRIYNDSVRFDLEVPGAGTWWCDLAQCEKRVAEETWEWQSV